MQLTLTATKQEFRDWLAITDTISIGDPFRVAVEMWLDAGLDPVTSTLDLTRGEDHYKLYISGFDIKMPQWLVDALDMFRTVQSFMQRG